MNAAEEHDDEPNQRESDVYEQFLRLFTADQQRLLAFILALVQDRDNAHEILQETSLVLWREFPSFRPGADFLPWAIGIARNRVLKFWRERKRDRHVFSSDLLEMLSRDAVHLAPEIAPRERALAECMQRLTPRQRQLVELFYGQNMAAGEIARHWGRSVHAVYKGLKVLRRRLLECIERKLAEAGS